MYVKIIFKISKLLTNKKRIEYVGFWVVFETFMIFLKKFVWIPLRKKEKYPKF